MTAYLITVNGDRFMVDSHDALEEWKVSVADRVQRGGGFVDLIQADGCSTTLLVTPNSSITMQEVQPAAPARESWTQLLADEAWAYEDL